MLTLYGKEQHEHSAKHLFSVLHKKGLHAGLNELRVSKSFIFWVNYLFTSVLTYRGSTNEQQRCRKKSFIPEVINLNDQCSCKGESH